jgi:hypothetical protein
MLLFTRVGQHVRLSLTNDPKSELEFLKECNGMPVQPLVLTDGGEKDLAVFSHKFAEYKTAHGDNFFWLVPAVADYIKTLSSDEKIAINFN